MARTAAASGLAILVLLVSNAWALQIARVAVLPERIMSLGLPNSPCGDADHDGHTELWNKVPPPGSIVGYEHVAGDSYQRFSRVAALNGQVDAVGDGDRDGFAELLCDSVGNMGATTVIILESPDSTSMPTDRVWQVGLGNCRALGYTKLDPAGRMQIAASIEGQGILLFENRGDNRYDHVATLPPLPSVSGYFTCFSTGDYDRDSLCELAAGFGCRIAIFEATGNDTQYVLSAVCTTAVDTEQTRCLETANDMDQDSHPELIALEVSPYWERLLVFEAQSHAQYQVVWQQYLPPILMGKMRLCVGDIDGDKTEEFAFAADGMLRLYKCTGPDQYEQVWSIASGTGNCCLFDVNGDGRAEITFDVYTGGNMHCDIYEDTEGLGVAEFTRLPQVHPLAVQPTIARLSTSLLFSEVSPGADIKVLSLGGRQIRSQPRVRQSSWTWDLRDQTGNLVPAGTYFAVIRAKGQSTSLKLCLVK